MVRWCVVFVEGDCGFGGGVFGEERSGEDGNGDLGYSDG